MEKSAQRRKLIIARIIEEDRRSSFNFTVPKRNRTQQTLIEKVSTDDFFTRMANDIRARKEKLVTLEKNLRLEKEKKQSFKPKTNVMRKTSNTKNK